MAGSDAQLLEPLGPNGCFEIHTHHIQGSQKASVKSELSLPEVHLRYKKGPWFCPLPRVCQAAPVISELITPVFDHHPCPAQI